MPSFLDSVFSLIFNRFLLPTSTPRISKIEPPLQREHDFSKNRFSQEASIFDRFWCQLGSILGSKIHQNPRKNRFQDASKKWKIFRSFFFACWRHFSPEVLPTWLPRPLSWPPRGSQKTGTGQHFSLFFWKSLPGRPGTDFGLNLDEIRTHLGPKLNPN